jgi:hypothetical protein
MKGMLIFMREKSLLERRYEEILGVARGRRKQHFTKSGVAQGDLTGLPF